MITGVHMTRNKTTIEIICTAVMVVSILTMLWLEFRPKPEVNLIHYATGDVSECSIPLKLHNGFLFVECLINDRPAVLLIDTGANVYCFR